MNAILLSWKQQSKRKRDHQVQEIWEAKSVNGLARWLPKQHRGLGKLASERQPRYSQRRYLTIMVWKPSGKRLCMPKVFSQRPEPDVAKADGVVVGG